MGRKIIPVPSVQMCVDNLESLPLVVDALGTKYNLIFGVSRVVGAVCLDRTTTETAGEHQNRYCR